ncbi:MAG: hypothetical protein U0871_01930 [Gemmataceae bacterium]
MAAGPLVRAPDPDRTERYSAQPFGPGAPLRIASADFTGDGVADVVAGTGPGGPSHVAVPVGSTEAEVFAFGSFEPAFTGRVYVAARDGDGDGDADLVFGGGPAGGSRVRVASGKELLAVADLWTLDDSAAAAPRMQLADMFAGDPSRRGEVRVAVKDADGDGRVELLTGSGVGEAGRVRVYKSATVLAGGAADRTLDPFPGVGLPYGAFVCLRQGSIERAESARGGTCLGSRLI